MIFNDVDENINRDRVRFNRLFLTHSQLFRFNWLMMKSHLFFHECEFI
jgi:hypothetical protein